MFFTPVSWAAKVARKREDRRPLYRRILTNRRLDIVHKTFVRSILGFILFSTSYCIVNTGIYYKFVRPLRQEEREILERELIEADKAGFSVHLKRGISQDASYSAEKSKVIEIRKKWGNQQMSFSRIVSTVASRWDGVFGIGVTAGAGFELFKIYFSFNGVNYYSVFKKKQMQKELDEFERNLKDLDNLIATGVAQSL